MFLLSRYKSYLYILYTHPDMQFAKHFLPVSGLSFLFHNGIFRGTKVLKFDEVRWIILFFYGSCIWYRIQEIVAQPKLPKIFSYIFLWKIFSAPTSTSLIQFELIFVYSVRRGSKSIFLQVYVYPTVPAYLVEKITLSKMHCLGTCVPIISTKSSVSFSVCPFLL